MLQQLFITKQVRPWFRNINKRLVKAAKTYFIDTGILCHVLNVDLRKLKLTNPKLYGQILENFVATELIKKLSYVNGIDLFHFRTHDDKEIDFIMENRNGDLCAIEVKSRSTVTIRDFDKIILLKNEVKSSFRRGVVLYQGTDIIPFADDLVALPMQYLWQYN